MMKGLLLLWALLLVPALSMAQLGEVHTLSDDRASIVEALEELNEALREYELLFERRAMLQEWVEDERGIRRERAPAPEPLAAYHRALRAAAVANETLASTSPATAFSVTRHQIEARLRALRQGVSMERADIEALSVQLESLRNEDVPPLF